MGSEAWATAVCISIIFICIFGIFSISIIYDKEIIKTDYQSCIEKCPKTFSGYFKDLECPQMCEELIIEKECSNDTSMTLCIIGEECWEKREAQDMNHEVGK